MKFEFRSIEYYEKAFNFAPKIECLMQNQIYITEMLIEILKRLDWRADVKDPIVDRDSSAKKADPEKFESHTPIIDRYHKSVKDEIENKSLVKMDRSNKATATGESDFEKQARKISEKVQKQIEEEPL